VRFSAELGLARGCGRGRIGLVAMAGDVVSMAAWKRGGMGLMAGDAMGDAAWERSWMGLMAGESGSRGAAEGMVSACGVLARWHVVGTVRGGLRSRDRCQR
jgi:hypothetical protein